MHYLDYTDAIARKFGVLLEKWPLQKFGAPGTVTSLSSLRVLFNAFKNGVTKFRTLDDKEWQIWCEAHERGEAPPAVTIAIAIPEITVAVPAPAVNASENGEGQTTTVVPSENNGTSSVVATTVAAVPPATVLAGTDAAPTAPVVAVANPATTQNVQGGGQAFVFIDGTATKGAKRPRKVRSDKGKPRGPRKTASGTSNAKANANVNGAPSGGAVMTFDNA